MPHIKHQLHAAWSSWFHDVEPSLSWSNDAEATVEAVPAKSVPKAVKNVAKSDEPKRKRKAKTKEGSK